MGKGSPISHPSIPYLILPARELRNVSMRCSFLLVRVRPGYLASTIPLTEM